MQFDPARLGAKDFQVDNQLPAGFDGHRLPDAQVLSAQHPLLGTIIQQAFINTHYSIRYHLFDVRQPFTLWGSQAAARLTSFLSVRSTMVATIPINQDRLPCKHSSNPHVSGCFS